MRKNTAPNGNRQYGGHPDAQSIVVDIEFFQQEPPIVVHFRLRTVTLSVAFLIVFTTFTSVQQEKKKTQCTLENNKRSTSTGCINDDEDDTGNDSNDNDNNDARYDDLL